jgi:serine-type D-Ala-D-Ala carboxypeptidase
LIPRQVKICSKAEPPRQRRIAILMERSISEQVREIVQGYAEDKLFTHCTVVAGSFHSTDPDLIVDYPNSDTKIYDLASLTKPLVTFPLILRASKAYGHSLEEPLADWKCWEKGPLPLAKSILQLTPRALLAHESGLPPWWNFWINQWPDLADAQGFSEYHPRMIEVINRAAHKMKDRNPCYSDVGFLLLQLLLESVTEASLGDQFSEMVKELKISKDSLHFPPQLKDLGKPFVPSGYCPLRGRLLVGEVHDENCASLGRATGHAGLFASPLEFVGFVKKLFASEVGQRMLDATSKQPMLGFRPGDDRASYPIGKGKGFGHYGFTGSSLWLTSATSLNYVIILCNRTIFRRIDHRVSDFRFAIHQLLAKRIFTGEDP